MRKSLEIKLIVLIGVILFMILGVSAFINTNYQRKQLLEHTKQDALAISDTIEKTLEDSMRNPDKQGVQETIDKLAGVEEIEEIRIFNLQGMIKFSSKEDEIGQIVEEEHRKILSSQKTASWVESEEGVDVRCLEKPILNQESCHPCHDPKQKVLGRLDVNLSIAPLDKVIISGRNMNWLLAVASFLAIGLAIVLFNSNLVNKPIKDLIGAMAKVEKGDLDAQVEVKRDDELGRLSRSFNIMINKIKKLQQSNIEKAKALSEAKIELKYKDEIEQLNKELQKHVLELQKASQLSHKLYQQADKTSQQLNQRVKDLAVLCEFGKSMSSVLDLEQLLKLIIDKSTTLFQAEKASLMLFDEDKEELAIREARGLSEKTVENVKVKYGERIAGLVLKEGEPLLVEDIEKNPKVGRKKKPYYKTKSFISLPLINQEEKIGVINISDKITGEAFNQHDLHFLSTMESQASIAISNAQLFQEVKKLAITDELTGLHNRRHVREELQHEIERSRRFGRPLSVLMADVDWFKDYNDRYGHPEGDKILRQIGSILIEKSRVIDIVARYGGEEFLLLLSETDKRDALTSAERLRKAVEEFEFDNESTQPDGKLTVSFGVATYPTDGDSMDSLIDKVDKALYQAKHRNRNQVCG